MKKLSRSAVLAVVAALLSLGVAGRSWGETSDPGWDVWIAPYLWALSMEGDAAIGHRKADVDVPFSDIVKDLNFGLMAFLDARKGKLGFFLNPILSRLKDEESVHGLDIDVTSDSAIIAAGAYYRVLETHFRSGDGGTSNRFIVEPYLGARWTYLRAKIDFGGIGDLDESVDWLDPIIGARMLMDLSPQWDLVLGADLGGFGVGSDASWNVQALFGYRFKMGQRDAILRFGYRALHQDYETGSGGTRFKWDVTQQGPMLGLALRF